MKFNLHSFYKFIVSFQIYFHQMMPDKIHDYTILEEIGQGGFGKVFRV
jgi:hypothetical protein